MNLEELKERKILLEAGTNEVEFLEFGIGNERFGVNVAKVLQILVWKSQKITRLPTADQAFLGTVSVRNTSIPAFDLGAVLKIPPAEGSADSQLLILMEFNQRINGFVVDTVYDIERISWNDFRPFDDMKFGTVEPCVIGTVTVENRIIMVLDMEALLERLDHSVSIETRRELVKPAMVDRSQIRVLYCEDSPFIRKLTLSVLTEAGFSQIVAKNSGAEGLGYLQTLDADQGVDIILTDIEMPVLDGLAFCKAVKQIPNYSKLPVIFFSSLITEQMKAKCMSVKGDACFSKPEVHMVAEAIEKLYLETKK